jgi:hypothetical protein
MPESADTAIVLPEADGKQGGEDRMAVTLALLSMAYQW